MQDLKEPLSIDCATRINSIKGSEWVVIINPSLSHWANLG